MFTTTGNKYLRQQRRPNRSAHYNLGGQALRGLSVGINVFSDVIGLRRKYERSRPENAQWASRTITYLRLAVKNKPSCRLKSRPSAAYLVFDHNATLKNSLFVWLLNTLRLASQKSCVLDNTFVFVHR